MQVILKKLAAAPRRKIENSYGLVEQTRHSKCKLLRHSRYDDVSLCSAIVSDNGNDFDDRLTELNVRGGLKKGSIKIKNSIAEKIAKINRQYLNP